MYKKNSNPVHTQSVITAVSTMLCRGRSLAFNVDKDDASLPSDQLHHDNQDKHQREHTTGPEDDLITKEQGDELRRKNKDKKGQNKQTS